MSPTPTSSRRRGVEWRKMLFNKRITGYVNLRLGRGRVHLAASFCAPCLRRPLRARTTWS